MRIPLSACVYGMGIVAMNINLVVGTAIGLVGAAGLMYCFIKYEL